MDYNELVTDWNGGKLVPEGDPSFDLMMKDLREDKPFAFSRVGDGEWLAILSDNYLTGKPKTENNTNADGAKYYDSLREGLREILKSKPSYKLGLQNFAWRQMPQPIENFIVDQGLQDLNWVTSDALHRANMKRPHQMDEFFKILRTKDVVLVGPRFLHNVDKFKFHHIEVPEKTAWLERGKILMDIYDCIKYHKVFVFACGMTTNYLINELETHASYGPDKLFQYKTFLDVGSLLDPYAKVSSRTYHDDVIRREHYSNML